MNMDGTINNSNELEFAVFCVENVAAKLGIGAEKVYKAFTDKSNILKDYIIPAVSYTHLFSAGVAMIDLDDFKIYNDTYGHEAGDMVLDTVVQIIKKNIRKSDICLLYTSRCV